MQYVETANPFPHANAYGNEGAPPYTNASSPHANAFTLSTSDACSCSHS